MKPQLLTQFITITYGYVYPYSNIDDTDGKHRDFWISELQKIIDKYKLSEEEIRKAFEVNSSGHYGDPVKPPFKEITLEYVDTVLRRYQNIIKVQNQPVQELEQKSELQKMIDELEFHISIINGYLYPDSNNPFSNYRNESLDYSFVFKRFLRINKIQIDGIEDIKQDAHLYVKQNGLLSTDKREEIRLMRTEIETQNYDLLKPMYNQFVAKAIIDWILLEHLDLLKEYLAELEKDLSEIKNAI